MKHIYSHIIGLSALLSFVCEGAGIVAWKEQNFHKDALANVSTYSQVKKTVYEGIFNIKGKEIYLPSGTYWFIELPKNLPLELVDSYQYEDILRQKGEMSSFLKRFPKSSVILTPWIEKLQEYQDKYDSGQCLVDGGWSEKSVYEKQQAELKEKKQRSRKEVQKRQQVSKNSTEGTEITKVKNPQASYVDGVLQEINDGNAESAGAVVKRLEQARTGMDNSGRNLAQQLIQYITLLFSAQTSYKNALQQQSQAEILAEKYERQAEDEMRPSPLTGKSNTYMANKSRNKAKQVLVEAEHAISNTRKDLLHALKQSDVLACSLYEKYPKDANSLSSALMVIAGKFRGEIDFRSSLEEMKNQGNSESVNGNPNINQELWIECEKDNVQNVEKILQLGANVNTKDEHGRTPLYRVSIKGHEKIAQLLIASGADVNVKTKDGDTPLHCASIDGHEKIVQLLITSGADVDVKNKSGDTPLYMASMEGHEKTVQLLIASEADVNTKDKDDSTSLHLASMEGHEKTVQLLIESGADVNVKDKYGMTPLHWASIKGHEKIVQLLIAFGSDVDAKNNSDMTPLHRALMGGHEKIVQLLIEAGADVNTKDKDDGTPLHLASMEGREKTVQLLIEVGADVNAKTKDGFTSLHGASMGGHEKIVQLLIEAGADVNAKNKSGMTPLDSASGRGCEKIVDILKKAADPQVKERREQFTKEYYAQLAPFRIRQDTLKQKAQAARLAGDEKAAAEYNALVQKKNQQYQDKLKEVGDQELYLNNAEKKWQADTEFMNANRDRYDKNLYNYEDGAAWDNRLKEIDNQTITLLKQRENARYNPEVQADINKQIQDMDNEKRYMGLDRVKTEWLENKQWANLDLSKVSLNDMAAQNYNTLAMKKYRVDQALAEAEKPNATPTQKELARLMLVQYNKEEQTLKKNDRATWDKYMADMIQNGRTYDVMLQEERVAKKSER